LPPVLFATRANVGELLKHGGAATSAPRGSRLRHVLTVAELAMAVVLLIGSALYARTYLALIGLDKGFDTANVAVVSVSLPARVYPTPLEKRGFATAAIDRLKAAHAIVDGMWGTPPPDAGAHYAARLERDGAGADGSETSLGVLQVAPSYFATLGIPLRYGRTFADADDPQSAIVNEATAARMWPGQDPVGRLFRWSPSMPWLRVVGVAGDVRTELDRPDRPRGSAAQVYRPL